MIISERIKELRKSKSLTQDELAAKSNLSKNAIWNYENNKRNPKYETLEKIAVALDISVSELLGEPYDDLQGLTLGEKIRKKRKHKKMKLTELAEILNTTAPTVSRYESNKREPNYETLLLISKALEVPISELLDEKYEEDNELLSLIVDKKNLDVEVNINEDYLFKLDKEEIEEINNKAKEIFRILLKGLL